MKFADDTALVVLPSSDSKFEDEVDRFVTWCRNNSLQLNVGKIQEMVSDFRKAGVHLGPLSLTERLCR